MQGFGRAVCAGLADRIQMAGVSCVPFLAHSPRGRKKLNGRSRPTLAAVGAFGSKRELLRWYFPNGVLQSVWAMGGGEEGNVTCKASWTESFAARAVCTRTHRPRSWPACARSPGGGVEPPHPLASRSRVRGHLEDRATRAARPRLFPRSAVAASLSHRHFVSRCFRRALRNSFAPVSLAGGFGETAGLLIGCVLLRVCVVRTRGGPATRNRSDGEDRASRRGRAVLSLSVSRGSLSRLPPVQMSFGCGRRVCVLGHARLRCVHGKRRPPSGPVSESRPPLSPRPGW